MKLPATVAAGCFGRVDQIKRLRKPDCARPVFPVSDALSYPRCSGRREVIATITQPEVIRTILPCLPKRRSPGFVRPSSSGRVSRSPTWASPRACIWSAATARSSTTAGRVRGVSCLGISMRRSGSTWAWSRGRSSLGCGGRSASQTREHGLGSISLARRRRNPVEAGGDLLARALRGVDAAARELAG
jgi:hypothetical protein